MAHPYGFEMLPDGKVQLNTTQATVIQKIYQLYVNSASLGVIADELESQQ